MTVTAPNCVASSDWSAEKSAFLEGLSAHELFSSGVTAYTYDDITILPDLSVQNDKVDLTTRLSRVHSLKMPVVSSPMDTVTEHKMAIAMALAGGLGVVHNNCTVEEQLEEVRKVKRFCQGLISEPLVLTPSNTVADLDGMISRFGFSTIPIVDEGKFLGMVTSRDVDFVADRSTRLGSLMTPVAQLLTCDAQTPLAAAQEILIASKKNALPMVEADTGRLSGLVTRSDCKKFLLHPDASRDWKSRLLCGAAVSTRPEDLGRAKRLVEEAEVDVLVVDSSQGNSAFQIDLVKKLKSFLEEAGLLHKVTVIGGNVVTSGQAENLIRAGVDGLRIGMGSGSICTTQEVCAVGRAQGSAVYAVASFVRRSFPHISIIADGGIRAVKDIAKALTLGADTVMVGSFVAGCTETPGEVFFQNGQRFKVYRGMGSLEAQMKLSGERYFYTGGVKVAQGVSGAVSDKGSVHKLLAAVRRELGKTRVGNCKSLDELKLQLDAGVVRFELNNSK